MVRTAHGGRVNGVPGHLRVVLQGYLSLVRLGVRAGLRLRSRAGPEVLLLVRLRRTMPVELRGRGGSPLGRRRRGGARRLPRASTATTMHPTQLKSALRPLLQSTHTRTDAPRLLVLVDLRLHAGHDRAECALAALCDLAHRPLQLLEVRLADAALGGREPALRVGVVLLLPRLVRHLLVAAARPGDPARVPLLPLVFEQELPGELLVEVHLRGLLGLCRWRVAGDDGREHGYEGWQMTS